ncbi:SA1362 family protein [Mesobacillus persicus]|uniref:SA1362 family protein n=1 Tax=Mesobacillus persicus TaxID=930146 RepID=UPI003138F7BA
MAFLKNKTSFYIVLGLIFLAAIGLVSSLVKDPGGLIKMLAGMALIVAVIFFLINRFSQASPSQNHEQRAFKKAAKRSKKRYHSKESSSPPKRSSIGSLSAARKKRKDASHLTVIEGKKGKKKNRASF